MATLLRSANFRAPTPSLASTISPLRSFNSSIFVSFKTKCYTRNSCLYTHNSPSKLSAKNVPSKFLTFSSSGEATETEEVQQPEIQDNTDEGLNGETAEEVAKDDVKPDADEAPTSPVITALQLYKEAIINNDESKVAELEAFFKSIEDEKDTLERKVASLSEDFSIERDRVLRISADFDNFRKRTDRERSSVVSNAQGEVVENFLAVLDNFERAKSQLKIESEAEEKINNSYQSIYKQFVEILGSIGVVPVETIGKPFDPLLHEAIMREDSTVYDEGVIIEEYRKGFKLGDRLLRPAMVKVSAGPGPEKPEPIESSVQTEGSTDDSDDVSEEGDSKDQATP
ncbi:uncharacterized protein LOC110700033 isoform X1 [Chenopodium quinoa]|uniref:GrpE protein homolog n=1 Tax=Chenopodium quinoa TaxID=63459 RepID=A0A803MXZ2_CHEQI|nr:uncharacterized protein LOC110700033 isoform X1 [Chenopodium quinoa]